MPDIDKIIEQLLGDRRMSESAAFSTRSYSDQPLIEKGSDLKARMERRAQERAERHEREARERREKAREAGASKQTWERKTINRDAPKQTGTTEGTAFPANLPRHTEEHNQGFTGLFGTNAWYGAPAREDLPELIKQMRELEGAGVPRTLAYGSSSAAALFYRQARLMEDYEDDCPYHGTFMQYYPTYTSMSNQQLRGYFTWRSEVRAGRMEPAPLSFAFIYAYELLMGIGTTPGQQGLSDLRAFGQAYSQVDDLLGFRLNNYLQDWIEDYAVYHNIPGGYQWAAPVEQDSAVLTLIKAEHAYLYAHKRSPKIPHPAVESKERTERAAASDEQSVQVLRETASIDNQVTHAGSPSLEGVQGLQTPRPATPTDEEVFQALGAAASYHICSSRLAKTEPELLRAVALDVFYALVMHCSKRRKTDYVEGLFGYASRLPYTMFSAAVFYEEEPHPDCLVRVSDTLAFECKDGRWWRIRACETSNRSSDLGLAMHAADFELREQLGYPYPLKRREVPKYLWKIVQETVAEHLERRAEAERRKITIDLSKLGEIRAAAAVTQEALLTDEERGESPAAMAVSLDEGPRSLRLDTDERPSMGDDSFPEEGVVTPDPLAREHVLDKENRPLCPEEQIEAGDASEEEEITPSVSTVPAELGLTPEEACFLIGLLDDAPVAELLGARAQFVSVVVDSINEKLFDEIGDAVIEFDGDNPCLVEDYLEDVREVLHA